VDWLMGNAGVEERSDAAELAQMILDAGFLREWSEGATVDVVFVSLLGDDNEYEI